MGKCKICIPLPLRHHIESWINLPTKLKLLKPRTQFWVLCGFGLNGRQKKTVSSSTMQVILMSVQNLNQPDSWTTANMAAYIGENWQSLPIPDFQKWEKQTFISKNLFWLYSSLSKTAVPYFDRNLKSTAIKISRENLVFFTAKIRIAIAALFLNDFPTTYKASMKGLIMWDSWNGTFSFFDAFSFIKSHVYLELSHTCWCPHSTLKTGFN